MPIAVKNVTEYRKIGDNLYKTYAETTADQVLYTPYGSSQTTVQEVLDGIEMPEVYEGATSMADGVVGLVPAATSAQRDYFFKGDGTWSEVDTITNNQIDTLFA